MHIVIRTYYGKGVKKLFDIGEQHEAELQGLMRSVEGLVSYTLARDRRGGFAVTVCRDKRGLQQSLKVARGFLKKYAPEATLAAMHISEGKVISHVK
jgi:hypothetical protein